MPNPEGNGRNSKTRRSRLATSPGLRSDDSVADIHDSGKKHVEDISGKKHLEDKSKIPEPYHVPED